MAGWLAGDRLAWQTAGAARCLLAMHTHTARTQAGWPFLAAENRTSQNTVPRWVFDSLAQRLLLVVCSKNAARHNLNAWKIVPLGRFTAPGAIKGVAHSVGRHTESAGCETGSAGMLRHS
jgi:hypothetical protein